MANSEIGPSQRQAFGPRTDIMDGKVSQRDLSPGGRLLVEHHHGAMPAGGDVLVLVFEDVNDRVLLVVLQFALVVTCGATHGV